MPSAATPSVVDEITFSAEAKALKKTAQEPELHYRSWLASAVTLSVCTVIGLMTFAPIGVGLLLPTFVAAYSCRRAYRRTGQLPFIHDRHKERRYYDLCRLLFRLSQANKVWLLKSRYPVDPDRNWGLSTAIERREVKITADQPPQFPYRRGTWSIQAGAVDIYALPHAFLVLLNSVYHLMPLQACRVTFAVEAVPEEMVPTIDSRSLGQVTQSKRTAHWMEYAFVSLYLADIKFTLIISNVEIAKNFVVDFCVLTGAQLDPLDDQAFISDLDERMKAAQILHASESEALASDRQTALAPEDLAIIRQAIAEHKLLSTSQVAAICGKDRDEITRATRGRRKYIEYEGFHFTRAGGRVGRELAWTVTESVV